MMKKNNIQYVIGIIFLLFSFYSVFRLTNFEVDYSYFVFILLICISTDIGGYIFGKFFKGKKLTKISPNKTYAGMFGSFTLSVVFSYLFLELTTIFPYLKFNSINMLIFILLISLTSQVGDIVISYFKRKSKIKNTGNLIPGHGGLLDRIDGMIFAFPFGYLVLTFEILN
jgi:phosphatidate cytidylyltransferase|tara:strand:+ start:103 stop:612 length:510 start_codon:yes stop_codon:yes gene_type:complete